MFKVTVTSQHQFSPELMTSYAYFKKVHLIPLINPLLQHGRDQGNDGGHEKGEENSLATVHPGAWGGEAEQLLIPGHLHQWWPHLDTKHHPAGQEGTTAAVLPEEAEETWACHQRSSATSTAASLRASWPVASLCGMGAPLQWRPLRGSPGHHYPLWRTSLPSLEDIVQRRACSIVKDPTHPQHGLFTPLVEGTDMWNERRPDWGRASIQLPSDC